ncbi:MAG: DUF4920 domain-containing protein [Bacteroidota bacterium]
MRYIVLLILVGLFSCEQKQTASQETKEVVAQKSYDTFGAEISSEGAVSPVEFVKAFSQDSLNVKISATATAVCKKKGCWMNVDLGNEKTMKVTFKDYGFFVPKDIENKKVIFEGVAKKQITPVDELKHYALDAGKSQEEIDAITEAKEEIVFEATGVLIETE